MNMPLTRNAVVGRIVQRVRLQRGFAFGAIIIGALIAFEIFNFSTTEFALNDLLGSLSFMSVRWATILAIAFCGIDFAGIARLFTPEEGADEPTEVWYLFGAWLLAATMNAMLTWWGVSIALLNHQSLGNAVIARDMLLRAVPIFVAVMVWLIRVLIIGTFSVAGERLFTQSDQRVRGVGMNPALPARSLSNRSLAPAPRQAASMAPRPPASRPASMRESNQRSSSRNLENESLIEPTYSRPDPTYHPAPLSAKSGRSSSVPFRK